MQSKGPSGVKRNSSLTAENDCGRIRKTERRQDDGYQMVEGGRMLLAGYRKNTRFGFNVIGQCWKKCMPGRKHSNRINREFLVGLNDYARWDTDSEKQPVFDYYAASEVERIGALPKGMEGRGAARYKIYSLCFRGIKEDSVQPVGGLYLQGMVSAVDLQAE